MAKGNCGDIRSHDMSDTHLQHRDIILLISWTVSWQAVRHQKQDMRQAFAEQPLARPDKSGLNFELSSVY